MDTEATFLRKSLNRLKLSITLKMNVKATKKSRKKSQSASFWQFHFLYSQDFVMYLCVYDMMWDDDEDVDVNVDNDVPKEARNVKGKDILRVEIWSVLFIIFLQEGMNTEYEQRYMSYFWSVCMCFYIELNRIESFWKRNSFGVRAPSIAEKRIRSWKTAKKNGKKKDTQGWECATSSNFDWKG